MIIALQLHELMICARILLIYRYANGILFVVMKELIRY
jgi:hypothetical protein